MRTEADENYLKEIYALEQEQSPVSTSRLARRFSYSPRIGSLRTLPGRQPDGFRPGHRA
jgi:Mn-dependent DtxR family transcriptional regulator